jgi:hypothetical protein
MLILALIFLVLLVTGIVVATKFDSYPGFSIWLCVSVVLCILFGVGVLTTGPWGVKLYYQSTQDYATILAAKTALATYKDSIDATQGSIVKDPYNKLAAVPSTGISIVGGLENMKQSTNTSDRVKEYRDYVREYETLRAKYQVYKGTWIFRTSIARMPVGLLE